MPEESRICLCMIVCNESAVIARALQSVRGLIDYWIICDTGSTDATPIVILQTLSGIPGELHRTDWVSFGHNRTRAIQLAKGKADYILVMDADMVANVYAPFKSLLSADYYDIRYEGDLDYTQPMLLADRHDWSYIGVTHEYVYAPTAKSLEPLPELTLTHLGDGGMRADKYERDIRLLTAALAEDPDNIRNTFYLAQSYKDAEQPTEALRWYERRMAQEGWEEERWYAMYQAARMQEELGKDWAEVLAAYLRAYEFRPARLEPLYCIVKHYRESESYPMGYTYAAMIGHGYLYPDDRLFIEKPVYDYLLRLEYGICAYGVGRFSESIKAFDQILQAPAPDWVTESAARGRDMAQQHLVHDN